AAGWDHSLALLTNGPVLAWGWNAYGQTDVPIDLRDVVAVKAGREHSIALRTDGKLVAWGGNSYGQTDIPINLPPVVAIAAGGYDNVAVLDSLVGPRLLGPFWRDGQLGISFWTALRKDYWLESRDSLLQTNWTMLGGIHGNGEIQTIFDPN